MSTEIPSLNNAVSGLVFQTQDPNSEINVDHKAFEISCIDLLSKLENIFATSKEKDHDQFIDESANVGRKMLNVLVDFAGEYLTGKGAVQAQEEITRAMAFVTTYEEVLKSRPIGKTLVRTFWNIQESEDILESHKRLGESLVRACAATFYHAVLTTGLDNKFGKEIDQSSAVFVRQLHQTWK